LSDQGEPADTFSCFFKKFRVVKTNTSEDDQMPFSTSIRLDQETLSQIDAIAAAEGRSRSWILQQAVKDVLEIRASYEEAVQKGIEQARAGQFAMEEEVEAVFAKYGA